MLRAMTKNCRMRPSAVMMSPVMPSEKYSWSGSLLRFSNGKTAIDGLSGSSIAPDAAGLPEPGGDTVIDSGAGMDAPGLSDTRNARTG